MSLIEVKHAIDELAPESLLELQAYILKVSERKVHEVASSRQERFSSAKEQVFGEFDHLLSELANKTAPAPLQKPGRLRYFPPVPSPDLEAHVPVTQQGGSRSSTFAFQRRPDSRRFAKPPITYQRSGPVFDG